MFQQMIDPLAPELDEERCTDCGKDGGVGSRNAFEVPLCAACLDKMETAADAAREQSLLERGVTP